MYTKAATILALGGLLSTTSAQLYGASSGSSTSAVAPAAAASTSSSAPQPSQSGMHIVSVSNAQGTAFAFNPSTIKAAQGDMVQFQFNPLNHSVVQGSFEKPCQPMSGGFFSGFQAVSTGASMPSFTITVNSTDPIWFYCSQTLLTHCQQGMVGVINPTSDQTFDMFQTAAKKTTNSISPPKAQGGVVGTVQAASSSSASPSASASSAASAANSLSLGISPVSILCMLLSVAIGGLFVAGMV
jgi:plastocyanin